MDIMQKNPATAPNKVLYPYMDLAKSTNPSAIQQLKRIHPALQMHLLLMASDGEIFFKKIYI
jgi:hypothetical protein